MFVNLIKPSQVDLSGKWGTVVWNDSKVPKYVRLYLHCLLRKISNACSDVKKDLCDATKPRQLPFQGDFRFFLLTMAKAALLVENVVRNYN